MIKSEWVDKDTRLEWWVSNLGETFMRVIRMGAEIGWRLVADRLGWTTDDEMIISVARPVLRALYTRADGRIRANVAIALGLIDRRMFRRLIDR